MLIQGWFENLKDLSMSEMKTKVLGSILYLQQWNFLKEGMKVYIFHSHHEDSAIFLMKWIPLASVLILNHSCIN